MEAGGGGSGGGVNLPEEPVEKGPLKPIAETTPLERGMKPGITFVFSLWNDVC